VFSSLNRLSLISFPVLGFDRERRPLGIGTAADGGAVQVAGCVENQARDGIITAFALRVGVVEDLLVPGAIRESQLKGNALSVEASGLMVP
jgi:hypothetical protein